VWRYRLPNPDFGKVPGAPRQKRYTYKGDSAGVQLDKAKHLYGQYETDQKADQLDATPGARTVGEVLTEWLAAGNWEPETRRHYERYAEANIRPALGAVRLDGLTKGHVAQFYGTLTRSGKADGSGMAPGTVRQVHAVLSQVLDYAASWEYVPVNVAHKAKLPKARHDAALKADQVPTTAQVLAMIDQASEADGTLFTVLAHCGLRRGEASALRWEDIDLNTGTLSVHKDRGSIDKQPGGWRPKCPKNGKGRTMGLSPAVVDRLRTLRATSADGYVFGTGETPIMPVEVNRKVVAASEATGPHRTAHAMRHFMATTLLDNQASMATVADRLGDTITVTQDTYVHFVKESTKAAASLLDI
jgi:integrase